MKIGIDARPLSHELTGIGRYTLNVITELFKLDDKIEWYLYSDRPLLMSFDYPNVHIRVGKRGTPFTSTLFSQCLFPVWAVKDKLDTFWSPRHHLPLALVLHRKLHKVVTIHDIVWKRHPETMSKFGLILEKLLFTPSVMIADAIITVSKFTTNEIVNEINQIEKKIQTIPLKSFISDELKQQKYHPYINDEYILFVGTLEPRKNLNNLLIAFKKVQQEKPKVKLVIVGKDGWGNISISDLAQSLGIEKSVVITGFVADEELLSLYQHCAILAMPSLYEGFGLPALEALSMKKKVVVSKFTAISDIEGDNIFLTELDSNAIGHCINEALEASPKLFADVDNNWSTIAERTLNLLQTEASRVSCQ